MKSLKQRLIRFGLCAAVLLASTATAQVSFPNGTPEVPVVDLKVKVLGGQITIDRQWWEGQWRLNMRWAPAELSGYPYGSLSCLTYPELKLQGRTYTATADGQAWMLEYRYNVQTIDYFPGNECQSNRIRKIKWRDRISGQWMEYERIDPSTLQFRLIRYGNRNDVTVNLLYDDAGQLTEVRDHFNHPVLQYRYSGTQLSEIRDVPTQDDPSPARSVKYGWGSSTVNGQAIPVITEVTDVLGNLTRYGITAGRLETLTDPEGRTRKYSYIADRVLTYTDGEGNVTNYVYDYNRLKQEFYVRITGPSGAKTENWYDKEGQLIRRDIAGQTITQRTAVDTVARSETRADAAGRKTTITRNEFGNLVKTEYPDGSTTSAKYSAQLGRVTEETDELGVKTKYDYDLKGNLIQKTETVGLPEQRITEYEVDQYGQVVKETRKGGNISLPDSQTVTIADASTAYAYDTHGNRSQVTDPLGHSTLYQTNRQGNVTQITDARGKLRQTLYDAKGQRLQTINPLGKSVSYQYDRSGNLTSITDALGAQTANQYDKENRLIATQDALGHTRTQQYDENGRLIATFDELGQPQVTWRYDPMGRLIETKDAASNTTQTVFDPSFDFAPIQIIYPTFSRKFTYDTRNRVTQTQDITTGDAPQTLTSATAYDKKGQPIQSTDRNGQVSRYAYDALGRLTQITDALNGVTRFTYDPRDNLIAVTDANGNTTRYVYDLANRRIQETRPLGQSQATQYDAVGNLTRIKDAKGNTIEFTYDDANRRTQETHIPVGADTTSRSIAYTRNAAGQLTGYTDSNTGHADHQNHSAIYTLDALGRRTQETLTYGNQTHTLKTGYTPTGRKANQTWPDGTQITYAWDGAQRLIEIKLPAAGSLSTTTFDAWNKARSQLYPGGTTRSQDTDGFARIRQIQVKGPNQTKLLQRAYTYDPESNITAIDTEQGKNRYTYDALYQLTGVDTAIAGLPQEQYTYDPLGNRLTDKNRPNPNRSDKSWRYDPNNRLIESATEDTGLLFSNSQPVTHTWDENGSLIQKTTPAGTAGQNPTDNQKYRYDAQNRLTEIQDQNGNLIASYQYDPYGRRIRKTIHRAWDGSAWGLLPETRTLTYLYTDEGLAAEYQQTGNDAPQQIAQYGWKPDGLWGTDPLWIKTAKQGEGEANFFYYQNDHLGTPQQVIDSQGAIVWRQKARAFGETTVDPTSTITNNLRFPGQYFDRETNTHQNYYRDYVPSQGRYIQSDPIGLNGDINVYTYAGLRPILAIDALGLDWGPILPPDENMNTIVCDGSDGIMTQVLPLDPLNEKCLKDCIEVHEGVHRADALAQDKNICAGKPKGNIVGYKDQKFINDAERKAYRAEIKCLEPKLLEICGPCERVARNRIIQIYDVVNRLYGGGL